MGNSDQWTVDSGQWKVDSGQWTVDSPAGRRKTMKIFQNGYVKVWLSLSQYWGKSLLCHFIFKKYNIFVHEFYNSRQHYEYKVF